MNGTWLRNFESHLRVAVAESNSEKRREEFRKSEPTSPEVLPIRSSTLLRKKVKLKPLKLQRANSDTSVEESKAKELERKREEKKLSNEKAYREWLQKKKAGQKKKKTNKTPRRPGTATFRESDEETREAYEAWKLRKLRQIKIQKTKKSAEEKKRKLDEELKTIIRQERARDMRRKMRNRENKAGARPHALSTGSLAQAAQLKVSPLRNRIPRPRKFEPKHGKRLAKKRRRRKPGKKIEETLETSNICTAQPKRASDSKWDSMNEEEKRTANPHRLFLEQEKKKAQKSVLPQKVLVAPPQKVMPAKLAAPPVLSYDEVCRKVSGETISSVFKNVSTY